jgi:hypothetical protein
MCESALNRQAVINWDFEYLLDISVSLELMQFTYFFMRHI